MPRRLPAAPVLLLAVLLGCATPHYPVPAGDTAELAVRLDQLRRSNDVPGMAAGILVDGAVLWTAGFGLADVVGQVPATDSTRFHLASLTKTIASVVILQLVEEGAIDLDAPVSTYGVTMPDASSVGVRHLLGHTSSGEPGSRYQYDGDRFAILSQVIAGATGTPFMQHAAERIILPLGMSATAPSSLPFAASIGIDTIGLGDALAQGYAGHPAQEVAYPTGMSASAGMISSVRDMLTYARALDGDDLLSDESKSLAFTPVELSGGGTSPYGLGWFSTTHRGERVVWHYGSWIGSSSLIVRVPARATTFVLLANSDGLSRRYPLASGDLDSSPFARAFLEWLGDD